MSITPQVNVVCIECSTDLEVHKTELKWDDYYLYVIPCDCVRED
jgi:hypothetical protein